MNKYKMYFNNNEKIFKVSKELKYIIEEKKISEDYIKYYFLSKFNDNNNKEHQTKDIREEINKKLINNFINIFIRTSKPIIKEYDCLLAENITNEKLFIEYKNLKKMFYELHKKNKYSEIIKIVMKFAKKINFYIEIEKPWNMSKNIITKKRAHMVYTTTINLFLILLIEIKSFIPEISKKIENILNLKNLSWKTLNKPILKIKIRKYENLVNKI